MAFSEEGIAEVREYLNQCPLGTQVFIGCDSQRKRDSQGLWKASYSSVVVVHARDEHGVGHGCRVFVETETEFDYDQQKNRPKMRMLREAYRAAELAQQLEHDLLAFETEVHLDINKDPKHGSNCAHSEAVGYVAGVTGLPVMTKPEAWAATHAADHGVRGGFERSRRTVH